MATQGVPYFPGSPASSPRFQRRIGWLPVQVLESSTTVSLTYGARLTPAHECYYTPRGARARTGSANLPYIGQKHFPPHPSPAPCRMNLLLPVAPKKARASWPTAVELGWVSQNGSGHRQPVDLHSIGWEQNPSLAEVRYSGSLECPGIMSFVPNGPSRVQEPHSLKACNCSGDIAHLHRLWVNHSNSHLANLHHPSTDT